MKKLLTITLSLIISCSFAQWEWQNPLPQGNSISALSFIDENNGWAVGWGTIMSTDDGGLTWTVKESDFGEWYYDLMLTDVCFTDAMNGWIVGGMPGFIFNTIDGGETWSSNSSENTRLPSAKTDVFFVNNQIGWVLGWAASIDSVYIQRTLDGGDSWDSYTVCSLPGTYDGSMYFVDELNGWVAWGGKIMHTIDGGVTWEVQFNNNNIYLSDIFLIDADCGWAVGGETVLHTENGGETWEASEDSILMNKGLNAVFFISNSIGWCGGIYGADMQDERNGAILKTIDGGITWENQLEIYTSRPILCLSYKVESGVIAAGEQGEILKTTHEGDDWVKISSSFTDCYLQDVVFSDSQNGWVSGGCGSPGMMPVPLVYNTKDGGLSWELQSVPHTSGSGYNYKLFFTDAQHGWSLGISDIYGGIRQLICTVDGGNNWEVQSTENIANDIYFINNSIGWRIGDFGVIQKSENGGWNWIDQQSGTDRPLKSIIFTDDNNGWIAGDSIVLHTSDGGQSWVEQSAGQHPWANIFFVDEQNGWVTYPGWGYGSGRTMRTLDGGQSWEEINDFGFHEIIFLDADIGWGRGRTDPGGGASSPPAFNMQYTVDGGLSWSIQSTPVLIRGGFCFTDVNNGWAVSNNGAILYTNNSGASDINESKLHHSVLVVKTQPNPFTTSTTLSYELKQPSTVQLSVFNQLGQLVYKHSEDQQQGEQQLQWDAQNQAEGLYFYILKAGDQVATGKLVKVK